MDEDESNRSSTIATANTTIQNNSNNNGTPTSPPTSNDGSSLAMGGDANDSLSWSFSQVKGSLDDEVAEGKWFVVNKLLDAYSDSFVPCSTADIISCVEFSHDGEFLATGDKGGRVVVFQRDREPSKKPNLDYNFYTTFQSHEAEFDYLKSLEIEEKINKIRWLRRKNAASFLLSTNDKTIKLWKIHERTKQLANFNLKDDQGQLRVTDPSSITSLRVPKSIPQKTVVEPSPRRIFANAHTYLINSISVNSDQETYLSADDLRINLWNIEVNDESFSRFSLGQFVPGGSKLLLVFRYC